MEEFVPGEEVHAINEKEEYLGATFMKGTVPIIIIIIIIHNNFLIIYKCIFIINNCVHIIKN